GARLMPIHRYLEMSSMTATTTCSRASSLSRPGRIAAALCRGLLTVSVAVMTIVAAMPAVAKPTLTVGSKRFTESYVLGDIIKQLAGRVGEAHAVHRAGLGNTGIVFAALK